MDNLEQQMFQLKDLLIKLKACKIEIKKIRAGLGLGTGNDHSSNVTNSAWSHELILALKETVDLLKEQVEFLTEEEELSSSDSFSS